MTWVAYLALGIITTVVVAIFRAFELVISRRTRARQREIQQEINEIATLVDARFRRRYGRQSTALARNFPSLRG